MPQHRNEPRVYTGKIRMLFGPRIGELVPHDYPVAQNLVAAGQAQWEQDETPLPRRVQEIYREKWAARAQQVIDDAAHSMSLRTPDDVRSALAAAAVELATPDVEIPDNWRTIHHMQRIGIAKRIKGVDAKTSMTKDEADGIIEEYLKEKGNDTRPVPPPPGREVREIDGKPVAEKTPAEIAKELEGREWQGDD
jgi:hypothetical protein